MESPLTNSDCDKDAEMWRRTGRRPEKRPSEAAAAAAPQTRYFPTLPFCLQTGRPTCHALPLQQQRRRWSRCLDADVDKYDIRSSSIAQIVDGAGSLRNRDNTDADVIDDAAATTTLSTTEWRHQRRRRREWRFPWITLPDVRWRSTRPRPRRIRLSSLSSSSSSSSSSSPSSSSCSSSLRKSQPSSSSSSFLCGNNVVALMAILMLFLVDFVSSNWQKNLPANLVVQPEDVATVRSFRAESNQTAYFKILMIDGPNALIGARDYVYNISLATLYENKKLPWAAEKKAVDSCRLRSKTEEECHNYIRVILKVSDETLLVCGTHAFMPKCRRYQYLDINADYTSTKEFKGIAIAPFDPAHNATAIWTSDNKLYSATVTDFNSHDPLIYRQPLRTEQYDSKWLNEPNYVTSLEHEGMVYFFFREVAVEYINCGKAVYSRVARVCKTDQGGSRVLKGVWTSFLKARLNCSVPGEFPFYFNEIQSTSDPIEGVYATKDGDVQDKFIYGVFTTPDNSISGSAVCAYRFGDIAKIFQGAFKEQKTIHSNWLPTMESSVPSPRPGACANDSLSIPDMTLDFIKRHPLMDEAVGSLGGRPLLIRTATPYRLTKIAIDQVYDVTLKRHDVIFVGTDNGMVIKAVNTGDFNDIHPVIIEEIPVFPTDTSVVNLHIYRGGPEYSDMLIVVSKDEVRQVPLHRCGLRIKCGGCVALQDPYCAWHQNRCGNFKQGVQNIVHGKDSRCLDGPFDPSPSKGEGEKTEENELAEEKMTSTTPKIEDNRISGTSNAINEPDPDRERVTRQGSEIYSANMMAVAVLLSIIFSLLLGFLIGYRLHRCRLKSDLDLETPNPLNPPGLPLGCTGLAGDNAPRAQNRAAPPNTLNINSCAANLNSMPNHNINLNTSDNYLAPTQTKQINLISNVLPKNSIKTPNGVVDTKPMNHNKVKKVYL